MMFLLDTNVVSELRRASRAHPKVLNWADKEIEQDFFLSAITVMEIEIGCLRMERRDGHQGKLLRDWLNIAILRNYEGRILPINTQVAQTCARLHVPDPKSYGDALIAATAIVHNLTVVTRNTADFEATGVRVFNPWL